MFLPTLGLLVENNKLFTGIYLSSCNFHVPSLNFFYHKIKYLYLAKNTGTFSIVVAYCCQF